MILAGDIGGTKTVLALFEDVDKRTVIKEEKFLSKDYPNLDEIVKAFLPKDLFVRLASFGIAGPIQNNRCHATNLPWVIEGDSLQKILKTPFVFLINDLEANAWGISLLNPEELHVLHKGEGVGNRALISAGTGLGEAGIYFDGKLYQPFATEGGHAGFSPETEEQIGLWRYLKSKFDHVSFERVLSGHGIEAIYRFLLEMRKASEVETVKIRMKTEDPAQVISEVGLNKGCPICVETLNWFSSIYGSESGNLALKMLALGGVYIGGGIAPKILDVLKNGSFMNSFLAKGRFKPLLSKIQVQVILNPKTALLGAAEYARTRFFSK
jgi:glucokinase